MRIRYAERGEAWRAVVLATDRDSTKLQQTIFRLKRCGWSDVNVFHDDRVGCPPGEKIVSHRVKDNTPDIKLLTEAVSTMVRGYARSAQRFIFTWSGTLLWEDLQGYLDATIPEGVPGIYLAHRPDRITNQESEVGCFTSRTGWIQTPVDVSLMTFNAICVTPMTAQLISAYLEDALNHRAELAPSYTGVVGQILGREYKLPFYFHGPSLAAVDSVDPTLHSSDFIGCATKIPQETIQSWKDCKHVSRTRTIARRR